MTEHSATDCVFRAITAVGRCAARVRCIEGANLPLRDGKTAHQAVVDLPGSARH